MSNPELKKPYLVFLGDAKDVKQAKVAAGVIEWRPDLCVGQIMLEGCTLDFGIPTLSMYGAKQLGAKTLLIGISPYETTLPSHYVEFLQNAIVNGYDIASPLHAELPSEVTEFAKAHGVEVHNFRHRPMDYPKGNGEKRPGLRLLTVGTDCAIGKKYTALSLYHSLIERDVPSSFRSTGQTGFLISESGINNDTIQADFLSGAAEWLSPANTACHWDLIEGQGALSHPSFGAGALSLIHGSQPDVFVMCTEPDRQTQRGVKRAPLSLIDEINLVLINGRRTNPNIRLGAISVMTKNVGIERGSEYIDKLSRTFHVPIFDPHIKGEKYEKFVDTLQEMSNAHK